MQGVGLRIDKRPEETTDAYKLRLLQLAANGKLESAIDRYHKDTEKGKQAYYAATGPK